MGFNLSETMESAEFTYSSGKYSCIAAMHFPHVLCTYAVAVCGFMCLIGRVIPQLTFTHKTFGRLYIIFMIWALMSALFINNTGLPVFVMAGFATVQGTLSLGFLVIGIHQWQINKQAMKNVTEAIKLGNSIDDLQKAVEAEKARICASKTWWQRVLSWKALHGALFTTSWVNIVGRIFATPWEPEQWKCYTYPYYKPVDVPGKWNGTSVGTLVPVPIDNPAFDNLPQTEIILIYSVGSMLICFAVGTIYSCIASALQRRSANKYSMKSRFLTDALPVNDSVTVSSLSSASEPNAEPSA